MPPISKKTTPSKDPNLVRIRDNQRRSRARRKEYLSELESKLSHCERVGVEASAEIQSAARKVLEENHRLRGLLRRYGIREEEIGGEGPGRELEGLLGRRRFVNGGSREGSAEVNADGKVALPRLGPTSAGGFAMRTPESTASSQASPTFGAGTGSSMATPNANESTPAMDRTPPMQPQPQPQVNRNAGANAEAMEMKYEPHPHANAPPTSQPQPTTHRVALQNTTHDPMDTNSEPSPPTSQPQPHYETTNISSSALEPNCSSCKSVASAIRSIHPDIGGELEVDLGCKDSNDCSVPNMHAFDVIDRYSDGRG